MSNQHQIDFVLLVDDDVNLLRGLSRTLRKQPYRVLTARSAEEAEDVVRRHPVSVVVSDERMPGKCGTEMLGWVAENCPEIVRIVLTGYPMPDTIRRAATHGRAFRFFTKPFDSCDLASAILEAIHLHHQTKERLNCPCLAWNEIPAPRQVLGC